MTQKRFKKLLMAQGVCANTARGLVEYMKALRQSIEQGDDLVVLADAKTAETMEFKAAPTSGFWKGVISLSESIMQSRRECYVCRMKYGVETVKDLEEHHVLNGPLRPVAEQYGLKVWLCHRHHNEPGYSAHFDHKLRLYLKKQAQRSFEDVYGHRQWMAVVGKDYLKCSTL